MTSFRNDFPKRMMVPSVCLQSLVVTCILFFVLYFICAGHIDSKWPKIISIIAVIMLCYQIYVLRRTGRDFFSFEIWLVIFSYLFMFGQIILVGLFGIETITALGYDRSVLDQRYSNEIMIQASMFVLSCIQMMVTCFVGYQNKKSAAVEKYFPEVFSAAIVMIAIGLPCHLIYSGRMIILAQTFGSYDAIIDRSGLIDDFSTFFIYGVICLIFSGRIAWKKQKIVIFIVIGYLVLVMGLTGDRRYQVASIIVLILSVFKVRKLNFSWKYIMLGVAGYFLLTLFYVLREIRTDNLVSFTQLIQIFINAMSFDNNILVQTMYEFGGSFYTVCLAFKYIPQVISFKYGLTIISGLISIIPLGFLYQNSKLFTTGRLASELMSVGATTVGASIFADFYGNFGFVGGIIGAGVIGVILVRLFYAKIDKLSIGYFNARYYILFYALIHIARASFTEVIRTTAWGLLVMYVSSKIFLRRN